MSGVAILLLPWMLGSAETHRHCEQNPVPLQNIQGSSPREARAELSSVLGPPTIETNQLPDGGQFARLELADLQDGVTQRYTWGEGTLDLVFQTGHVQLAALRLDEYETYVRGKMVLPCEPLSREQWSKVTGVSLPRKASTSKMGRGQTSFRYEKKPWMVRLRCSSGNDTHCTDASVYLPNDRPSVSPAAAPVSEPIAEAEIPQEIRPLLEKPVHSSQGVQHSRRKVLRGR